MTFYRLKHCIISLCFLLVASFYVNGAEEIRILAIGNSFSEDAVENYLHDIAKADGVTFIIGNMYIPGCDLETHWNNANGDVAAYSYRKIDASGNKTTSENTSILTAVTDEPWDYISFQQASPYSGMYDTYFPYLTNLLNYVKTISTNPNVKYVLHSTWAYATNSTHSGFANYGNNQDEMYDAIIDASSRAAQDAGIAILIPSGTAVQNGRSSFVGDNFCRDGYHLDMGIGRYTVAFTWYEKLTGNPILNNTFAPQGIASSRVNIAKSAAHYAVTNPFSVTDMTGENPFPAPETYTLSYPINIDFGSTLSALPWNNISSPAEGTFIYGLLDSHGNETPVKIEINDAFGNINKNGPAAGLTLQGWEMPAEVTSDSFWGNAGTTFENKNEVTGGFLVSNLNINTTYDFTMLSSRTATDNREISFKVIGNIEQMVYVNGSSNTTQLAKISGVKPKADGTVTIVCTAGPNNNNATKFFYINALQIAPTAEPEYTVTQTLYFDFGPNDVTNGNSTVGADINGNYWNNPSNPKIATAQPLNLVNSANQPTNYIYELTKNFSSNGLNHGGLKEPSVDLLGEFAVKTATQDYFFVEGAAGTTGAFKLTNLDTEKGYCFYMFGSRIASTNPDNRLAKYVFTGLNTIEGVHQTTGIGLGGTGYNANNSTIFVSDMVYPDSNGDISVEVIRQLGSYAHLNIMKVVEYEVDLDKATSLIVTGNNIEVSGSAIQMNVEVTPANALVPSIDWSVDNEEIAWIDSEGILYPKANGTIVVTAKIKYSESNVISNTKAVTISNQVNQFYLSGIATENGDNIASGIPMKMVTDLKGTVTNIFEVYTSLSGSGTFNFYSSQDAGNSIAFGEGGTEGTIVQDGSPITPVTEGTVLITVDLNKNEYTIIPITEMSVVGSAVPNGWNQANGIALNYAGNGVWAATVDLIAGPSGDPSRIIFVMNKSWDYSIKQITGTENRLSLSSQATTYGYTVKDIDTSIRGGRYLLNLNLNDYTYSLACESVDALKISVMGSSVANGQGATNMQGYAYMYGQLLNQRYANNQGLNWQTSGISVNGNNTTNLLNRWEKDLIGDCSGYVIYGLSLGNEGVHDYKQASFDSYRDNMQLLISKAREKNKIPVMSNSYTRGDFEADDYEFVKQMNLLIHEWDLPSINLLGAIDNGAGKWADGYQVVGDIYHPTTEGHAEFFYAMVPSLFDALEAGKPLPERKSDTYYTLDKEASNSYLEFVPENIVHPFTVSFDVKTSATGTISSFETATGTGSISIDPTGKVVYQSPTGGSIFAGTVINDGQWHRVSLTHYYARGTTFLYVDDASNGSLDEKLVPNKFYIGKGSDLTANIDLRELFFYRSAMNIEEIKALYEGKMLKSSLEIYAPFDGQGLLDTNSFVNLAQSTNSTLTLKDDVGTGINNSQLVKELNIYPNPVYNVLNVGALSPDKIYNYVIYGTDGKIAGSGSLSNAKNDIDVSAFIPSFYTIEFCDNASSAKHRLNFIKK